MTCFDSKEKPVAVSTTAKSAFQNSSMSKGCRQPIAADLANAEAGEESMRRRSTSSSSTMAGDICVMAGPRLDSTCDQADDIVEEYLMQDVPVEGRYEVLRQFILRLLQTLHEEVGRHRVLLQLVARRLPPPTVPDEPAEWHEEHSVELLNRLRRELRAMTGTVQESSQEPMTQAWTTLQLPLLSPFALDIMGYLECDTYDTETKGEDMDTQSVPSNEDYVPGFDQLRNQPGFHDSMLQRRPAAVAEGNTQTYDQDETSNQRRAPLPALPRLTDDVKDRDFPDDELYDLDRQGKSNVDGKAARGSASLEGKSRDKTEGKCSTSKGSGQRGPRGRRDPKKEARPRKRGKTKVVTEGLKVKGHPRKRDPDADHSPREVEGSRCVQEGLADYLF